MSSPAPLVVALDSAEASVELVGGKGWALSVLARAGLPVPRGFLISTHAYAQFVQANDLEASILDIASGSDAREVASVESASSRIREHFESASMPAWLESSIRQAYTLVADEPVAVRSSATAEDSPDTSFAGQHDTFLNVRGEAAMVVAVRRCWASLWTARAISYRTRMGVDHGSVAMGVVVQVMVKADVSGVLFSANPATGDRSEIVVNATFGLGEAVVGGHVTADTFVLDRTTFTPKRSEIGTKHEMVVFCAEQGTRTEPVPEARTREPALSARLLAELAALSLKAEARLGERPQDIEWAVADGRCWILQSRPITGLPPPAPKVSWDPPHAGSKLVRRQVVENMPEPLSPLFEELYLTEGLDRGMDDLVTNMGLPFGLDDFISRPMFVTVNGYGYCRYDFNVSRRLLLRVPRILYWYVAALPKWLNNLVPLWRDEGLAKYLSAIEEWTGIDATAATDQELLRGVRTLAFADARYWFYITMMVGAAKMSEALLDAVLPSRTKTGEAASAVLLRGFSSKTLQAQRDLAAIAKKILGVPRARELVLSCPVGRLMGALESDPMGEAIRAAIAQHLEAYGHQVYNLDFVEPTQAEEPTPVLLSLQAFVRDPSFQENVATRQATMVEARESFERKVATSIGPVRRWLFRKALTWARRHGPYREEALFYMGAAWPTLRRLALELGARLRDVGTLSSRDDVFYLRGEELEQACAGRKAGSACTALGVRASVRRALREERKRLHPPGRVPEDLRFKLGPIDFTRAFETFETQKRNARELNVLRGFAVSPGRATARASVIRSPGDFADMKPGSILVCPATTPAWTPLIAQASGLVTDIGAILAHGSIVAREYGIPAVLGTGNVTTRVISGQRLAVDGDSGTVTILDGLEGDSAEDRLNTRIQRRVPHVGAFSVSKPATPGVGTRTRSAADGGEPCLIGALSV